MGGARAAGPGVVERVAGQWTPTVHDLLRHLRAAGVPAVPEPLGVVGDVELQRRLPGGPGWHPPHPRLRQDGALGELADWLGAFHAASATFAPDRSPVWATGQRAVAAGEVVVHGDLGPWNTLWDGQGLTGVVDWDLAEPAPAWWDLANIVWGHVPVTPPPSGGAVLPGDGVARTDDWVPDRARRLAVLGEALGRSVDELLVLVADWLALQVDRRTTDVPPGPLWSVLAARHHDVAGLQVQRDWLDAGAPGLR